MWHVHTSLHMTEPFHLGRGNFVEVVSLPFLLTPVTIVILDKVSSYMCICRWVKCALLKVHTNMYRVRIDSITEKITLGNCSFA